jgi:hypothetical protein
MREYPGKGNNNFVMGLQEERFLSRWRSFEMKNGETAASA